MEMNRRFLRVAVATLFALLSAMAAASLASAAEKVIEGLSGAQKFAPLWPGGSFEMGNDSGFRFARVVTDGKKGASFIANVRPYTPMIDASGKFLKVWVKVDDASKLGGMEFRLSSDRFSSNYFAFSFPMYDDTDFNVLRDRVWTPFTFSFGGATVHGNPDRSAINAVGWFVSDKGEDAPATAYWGGMSLVDEPSEGVVSLTFDDGYDEHFEAAKIMKEYGLAGTAYVIPDSVGQHGYMNLHQMVALVEDYGWDVAAHHEDSFTEMSPDQLESTIMAVQRYLAENDFEAGAAHLAYPLGKQNTSVVRPLVRKHFATARVAGSGPETLPPADPHLLRVVNITNQTTPQQVGEIARRARENKEWVILMFHYLVGDGEADLSTEYTMTDFRKAVAEIAKQNVRVMPLAEVWDSCNPYSGPCQLGTIPAKAR